MTMVNLDTFSDIIQWINSQGWSPATSTNYSCLSGEGEFKVWLSRSGVDKSLFNARDFILMNLDGELHSDFAQHTPSAETALHLAIYEHTDAAVVLHTHSKADTLLSRLQTNKPGEISLANYELLKGLSGITTHETETIIPCFPNTQNIPELAERVRRMLENNQSCHGFLIESHGLYTWGKTLAEAKRHLEVLQFLFDCELELIKIQATH